MKAKATALLVLFDEEVESGHWPSADRPFCIQANRSFMEPPGEFSAFLMNNHALCPS